MFFVGMITGGVIGVVIGAGLGFAVVALLNVATYEGEE